MAEGVETRDQLSFLVERGCTVAQGFLFGQPMTAKEVVPFLEDLIDDAAGFGLQIDAEFRDWSLEDIRKAIDEEFYILSEAYYERYVGVLESA